jgi:3-oxoacyl-[acyl-carrier-protein] synthase-3
MKGLPVEIWGAGVCEPGILVESEALDRRFGKPAGWVERLSGVRRRRFADLAAGETASQMAERAVRAALDAAGLEPGELSAVLGASAVMEQPIPGLSVLVHRRLGLAGTGIPAFDVNATCLSFLNALHVAALHVGAGLWSKVAIVSSDVASAALDPYDPMTATLFGDGAAAVIVGPPRPGSSSNLLAWRFETYSEGAEAAWLGAGGSRLPARDLEALLAEATFRMDGPLAYRVAARRMPRFVEALLAEAGHKLDDMDLIVPHQASGHALELMGKRLGLQSSRIVRTLSDCGNQVAASMPGALSSAIGAGRIQRGDRMLLIGTGAGV